MAESAIKKVMTGLSAAEKKKLFRELVTVLVKDLNEAEKEEMIRTVAANRKEGRRIAALVDE